MSLFFASQAASFVSFVLALFFLIADSTGGPVTQPLLIMLGSACMFLFAVLSYLFMANRHSTSAVYALSTCLTIQGIGIRALVRRSSWFTTTVIAAPLATQAAVFVACIVVFVLVRHTKRQVQAALQPLKKLFSRQRSKIDASDAGVSVTYQDKAVRKLVLPAIENLAATGQTLRHRELMVWSLLHRERRVMVMSVYISLALLVCLSAVLTILYGNSMSNTGLETWLISASVCLLSHCLLYQPLVEFGFSLYAVCVGNRRD